MGHMSVSDLSSLVQAGMAVGSALGGLILFVWGRVEKINRDRKREIRRCTEQRNQEDASAARC